jgi:hypothetical protein
MTDINCPYCGRDTLFKTGEMKDGDILACSNPDCDSNHPPRECEQFNVVRQGMCKARLDSRGECPDQLQHGDEFSVRS